MHGLFASDAFRAAWLKQEGLKNEGHSAASGLRFEDEIEKNLDALADHLEEHADINGIAQIAGLSAFS